MIIIFMRSNTSLHVHAHVYAVTLGVCAHMIIIKSYINPTCVRRASGHESTPLFTVALMSPQQAATFSADEGEI